MQPDVTSNVDLWEMGKTDLPRTQRISLMISGLAEDDEIVRCVVLAGGSCNGPNLGSAGPRGSSTQSPTSNGSWVLALLYL